MVYFTKQLRRIVAAKGLADSYIGFHKDVKNLRKYATNAKYRDFTWGKFEPFATLRRGKKWSHNLSKIYDGFDFVMFE